MDVSKFSTKYKELCSKNVGIRTINTKRRFDLLKPVSIFALSCHLVFTFSNPDMYFGIADYFIFLALFIISGGLYVICNHKKFDNFSKYILFILVWLIVPTLIALFFGKLSTGYFYSYIVYIVALFIALTINYSKQDIRKIINIYVLSGVVIGLIILIQKYDYYGGGGVRYSLKFFNNEAFDPNFLGAFLLFPSLISFAKLLKKCNIFNVLATTINCGGMFFTSSRAAMLSFIFGGTIILLYYFKRINKHKKILVISILLACVIIGAIVLPKNILERFFSNNYFDSSNKKRLLDWFTGIEAFLRRPILGYGFRSELNIIQDIMGVNLISHNTYIAFMLQFGIVGFGILFGGLLMILKIIRKNLILIGLLLSNLFICVFISAETSTFFWLPLIIIAVIAKYEKRGIVKNEWL